MIKRGVREQRERSPEEEARGKIRDWLHDPKLKFHFSRPRDMKRILEQGILSHAFAEYMEDSIPTNLYMGDEMTDEDWKAFEKISIADRERNPEPGSEGFERREDWWLKRMQENDGYVGYLLPSDMKVLGDQPHVHESYADLRIRPQKIEGLFVFDDRRFREAMLLKKFDDYSSVAEFYAEEFLGYDHDQMSKDDEELCLLLKQADVLRAEKKHFSADMTRLLYKMADRKEVVALKKILEVIPKKKEDITRLDFYIYHAKQRRLPLYVVSKDRTEANVVWPEEK